MRGRTERLITERGMAAGGPYIEGKEVSAEEAEYMHQLAFD
jgi:hypothetical protein